MSFFATQQIGRVYVIRMVLPDDTVVHKIGMCKSSRSVDRMMELLRSWFMSFRFIPYIEMRLDMQCQEPAKLELHIHKVLDAVRWVPDHQVEGRTEMFTDVNEVRLLHYLRAWENAPGPITGTTPEQNDIICNLLTHKCD